MTDPELCGLSAGEIAAAIRAKDFSPVDVVRSCIERIEAVNPKLNCFCFVYGEEALAAARKAEEAVMKGEALGPLPRGADRPQVQLVKFGFFAVIDESLENGTPTKGKRTTLGSSWIWIARTGFPTITRPSSNGCSASGAIMVGKTMKRLITSACNLAYAFQSWIRPKLKCGRDTCHPVEGLAH